MIPPPRQSVSRGWPVETSQTIYWQLLTGLLQRYPRFDSKPRFKCDKTYEFCGPSSALAVSLWDSIIDRGIRSLVLTSRIPKIDPAWFEDPKRNRITICYVLPEELLSCLCFITLLSKIFSSDVTNENALRAMNRIIVESLLPIVGVLNSAVVLRDVIVLNIAFDRVANVIRPKVLESMHLDRTFRDLRLDLDFFVLLCPIICVIGDAGQASYAAANRRRRCLALSVVDVRTIIGVGYIT